MFRTEHGGSVLPTESDKSPQPTAPSRVVTTTPNIVLCCDGSWCGPVAGTTSNIQILANSFAGQNVGSGAPVHNDDTNATVCYFAGVGLTGAFSGYLVDGALALDIKDRCVEAYMSIVQHYSPGSKIWMFGLSRGAYTVRCVAGMINNCGIIRRDGLTDDELCAVCCEVYAIYRNRDRAYNPQSEFSRNFRESKSHPTKAPPIRFMGLLDTVGALGVPQVTAGTSLSYEFYDQNVSWEVETVCQACATHDRLSVFTPCFVRRSADIPVPSAYKGTHYETQEVWFPGSHYDIGRQRFIFTRDVRGMEGWLHGILGETDLLGINIMYTPSLSNAPLLWLIERVKAAQPEILPDDNQSYLQWADDAWPPLYNLPPFRPLTIDAYDGIVRRFGDELRPLQCVSEFSSAIKGFIESQVLVDRDIPQCPVEPAQFYRMQPGEDNPSTAYTPFISQSFQRFILVDYRRHEFIR